MNQLWLLLALLVLSYVVSMLVTGRTIRGFGLPSGSEYVLLGFVLGPSVLGLVSGTLVESFSPVLVVGAAWTTLVAGAGIGYVGSRPVKAGRAAFGIFLTTLVFALLALGAYFVLGQQDLPAGSRLLIAGGAGAVGCETTRHAARWVAERHGARGPLSETIADHARTCVLVPAVVVALLFASTSTAGLSGWSLPLRVFITVGVGVVLGLVATLLLGRDFRRDESWGVLLGTSLLAVGIAARLDLSAVSTTFFLGLTIALVSPHRTDVKAMVAPTEKAVMLPVALLAGASVVLPVETPAKLFVAVCILVRLLAELVRGGLLTAFVRAARPVGPTLGFGLTSSGAFSLACAVSLKLRFPGEIGNTLLALAVALLLLGELVGPLMLRRGLRRAGEISATESPATATPGLGASKPPEGVGS